MDKQDLIFKVLEMLIAQEPSIAGASSNKVENKDHDLIGKPVIVRSSDSGVHFGYLVGFEGRTVELKNTRRMWRWWAAKQMTLSAVAEFGLNLEKDLRIQNELPSIVVLDACEIIPCSEACVETFKKVEPHDEQ